jgi:hypothetical protein
MILNVFGAKKIIVNLKKKKIAETVWKFFSKLLKPKN